MINSVHVDFHTQNNITDFGKAYDPERFADILASAGVGRVNLFARCNQGYSYYRSETAEIYPYMKGDMFGETLKACRTRGISVFAYFNAATNITEAAKHPDWVRVEPRGECLCDDPTSPFSVIMCLSSGYREYLLETLDEILEYHPDGIFADNILPLACDCPRCREKSGGDIHNFAYESALSLCREIRKRIGSKTLLNIKGMPYESVADICDSLYVWENIDELSLYLSAPEKTEHLVGRFIKSWGDFGGYAGYDTLDDAYTSALFRSCGFCLGDHLHPAKNLDERIYSDFGRIISSHKAEARELEGSSRVFDAAILVSSSADLGDSVKGAAKLLSEEHILYDIVTPNCPRLDRYDFLVVPSGMKIDENTASALNAYRGGLIAAGETFGNIERIARFSPVKQETNSPYFALPDEMPYSTYSAAYLLSGHCTPLAAFVEPYNERERVNNAPRYYTPPESASGVIAGYSERTAYIGFDIFSSYAEFSPPAHKALFKSALRAICAKSSIVADTAPDFLRFSLSSNPSCDILQMKLPMIGREAGRLSAFTVTLGAEYSTAEIGEKKLNIRKHDGKTDVDIPEMRGYIQLLLKK